MEIPNITPMTSERINEIRQRIVAGETVPEEELCSALAFIVSLRSTASERADAAKPKKEPKRLSMEEAQKLLDGF